MVACLSLIFSLALLTVYLFHVVEKYHNIKWLKIELVGSIVLVFLNLISSTIVVAFGSAAFSAAGVSFKFFLYAIDGRQEDASPVVKRMPPPIDISANQQSHKYHEILPKKQNIEVQYYIQESDLPVEGVV